MTAFFVATVRIKDAEKFQDYAAKAGKTFEPHGGRMVIRGKAEETLAGNGDRQAVGVVAFPDVIALNRWFNSAEYQQLVPLREEAAEMSIVAYSAPD